MKIHWKGNAIKAQFREAAAAALTEIDLRIETAAKRELYPGHGKRTGALQRSIYGEPGQVSGKRVVGRVGTRGVPYALRMHRRYQYLANGVKTVRPRAAAILARHMNERAK
jgi:hypothetical protein